MADFASRYISEVEAGKGFVGGAKSAATGTMKDIGKTFSKENLVRSFFGGDDIFSAAIRSQFGVKKKPSKEKPATATQPERIDGGKTSGAIIDVTTIKIIAKNSMSLPGIARDMNVLRQNLQKLVKIWGDKDTKAATGADAQFLKEGERDKKLEVESEEERAKALDFFKQEDAREAEMEKDRGGDQKATAISGEKPEAKKEGGFLGSFIPNFAKNFISGFKKLFTGGKLTKILGKVFTKVFLPLTIIATLFSGITAGFKKYQETGSFKDAIVAGLGGMLDFITFGLVGEEELRNVFESVSKFLDPIMDKISEIFTGIKNFFIKLFGGTVDVKDDTPTKVDKSKPETPDTKQFLPNKDAKTGPDGVTASKEPKTGPDGALPSKEEIKTGIMKTAGLEPTKEIGEKDVTAMAERAGVPKGVMGDLGGVLEAGKTGGFEAMIAKAKELEQKYPAPPPTPESPVPLTAEGIPLDQAQRNFELNTALTGRASAALGMPLEAPKAPEPAKAPAASTPTVTPESDSEVKKLQEYFNRPENAAMLSRLEEIQWRINVIRRGMSSTKFLLRDETDPTKIKELQNSIKLQEAGLDAARSQKRSILDEARKSLGMGPEKGSIMSPSATPATESPEAPGASSSGGGGGSSRGGTVSAMAGGESAPAPITAEPPTSGASLSTASSEIAEAQRMESAAEQGSIVNAPTTNNKLASDKTKSVVADVYNSDFAKMLATT